MISGLIKFRSVTAEDSISVEDKRSVALKFLKGFKDFLVDLGRNVKFIGGIEYNGPIVKTRVLLSGGTDPETLTPKFQEDHPTGEMRVIPIIIPPNGVGVEVERRKDGTRMGVETHITWSGKDYVRVIGDPGAYDRMFAHRVGRRGRPPKIYREHLTQEKWDLIKNPPPPKAVGRPVSQETGPLSRHLRKKMKNDFQLDLKTYEEYHSHMAKLRAAEEAKKKIPGRRP